MIDFSLFWPVGAAMVAGGLIGVERTYHGHPAGFRTHILVCMTSCLLMLAAMHQSSWSFTSLPGQNVVIDPTRMAHGLLTGIGFLCAGAQLPHIGVLDVHLRWIRGAAPDEAAVRVLLSENGLKCMQIGHVLSPDGQLHEHHIKARGQMPLDIDSLVRRFSTSASLAGFSVIPRDN